MDFFLFLGCPGFCPGLVCFMCGLILVYKVLISIIIIMIFGFSSLFCLFVYCFHIVFFFGSVIGLLGFLSWIITLKL